MKKHKKDVGDQTDKRPTPQEIADYLAGLNRTAQAWIATADTGRLKARAVSNYVQWFRAHGIAIEEDMKSHTWRLGSRLRDG
jgi:hypothetical protein